MSNIKIEIDDRPVIEAFNRLLAAGEELDPILNALGGKLKENIQDGLQSGTDPYGRPWKLLKSRSGKPLLNRGNLFDSITYQVEGDSVLVGTNKPYAPVHQFGATIEAKSAKALRFFVEGKPVFVGRGHKITIPPRPFLPTEGLPQSWADDCIDVIGNVLRRAWDGRGTK